MADSWIFFLLKNELLDKVCRPLQKKEAAASFSDYKTDPDEPAFLSALIAWKMSNAPREGSVDRKF